MRSIELERTCLCLMVMDAVVKDNYTFLATMPVLSGKNLTNAQFKEIKKLIEDHFPADSIKLLRLELILGDFGKIKPLREKLCLLFGIQVQDPDQFMSALFEQDFYLLKSIFPCFTPITQAEFLELKNINTGFHYGHFAHAESTEREVEKLRKVIHNRGLQSLYRNFLVQIFDVAGAAAQDAGKILLNETLCSAYFNDILSSLKNLETQNSQEVYQSYLIKRLKTCELLTEATPSSPLESMDYFLARLLCMFRIYDKKSALQLKQALQLLSNDDNFQKAVKIINQYQAQQQFSTPTYMPAFLNGLKASPEIMRIATPQEKDAQTTALRIGIGIIADVLNAHDSIVSQQKLTSQNPVNFNQLTGIVKINFDIIKELYSTKEIAIGKSDGIAYPSRWLLANQSYILDKYIHTHNKYAKPVTDFFNQEICGHLASEKDVCEWDNVMTHKI